MSKQYPVFLGNKNNAAAYVMFQRNNVEVLKQKDIIVSRMKCWLQVGTSRSSAILLDLPWKDLLVAVSD
jgi:hypothetical protein